MDKSKEKNKEENLQGIQQKCEKTNAILNLLQKDIREKIEDFFLDTNIGDGFFLIEKLSKKIEIISEVTNSKREWIFLTFVGLSTIYGISSKKEIIYDLKFELVRIIKEKASELNYNLSNGEILAFVLIAEENLINIGENTSISHNGFAEIMLPIWDFSELLKCDYAEIKFFSINEIISCSIEIKDDKNLNLQQIIMKTLNFKSIVPYWSFTNLDSVLAKRDYIETKKLKEIFDFILLEKEKENHKIPELFILIAESLKDENYILEAPISDVAIMLCNNLGFSDEFGNFFFIKLRNGDRRGPYKLDKENPEEYIGDFETKKRGEKKLKTERWIEIGKIGASSLGPIGTPIVISLEMLKWKYQDKE